MRSPWSTGHRPLTWLPLCHTQASTAPHLGTISWAALDPRTVLQQNQITGLLALARHCTIHPLQNSGSQKPLSVSVTLTQPKFHVSLDSFLSSQPTPHFRSFSELRGCQRFIGLDLCPSPGEYQQSDSRALLISSPSVEEQGSCPLEQPTLSFRFLGV